jgi:Family of unknown function (DUF6510)
MDESALRLDGNAIAGLLHEVFAVEMTTATSVCDSCGAVGEVGALTVYAHAPGVVVRCPHCEAVLMRIVSDGTRYWLDLRGVASLGFSA